MAVKIRLQRKGRKKRPYYHIVVADSRSKRDGKYIERIGSYNPLTNPATITLDNDKAFEWIMNGAQPSYTATAILRFKGVLYRKHLARGVKKGALTEEQAKNLYEEFMAGKNEKIQARMEKEATLKAEMKSSVLVAPIVEEKETIEETETEEQEVQEDSPVEAGADTSEESPEVAAKEDDAEPKAEVSEEPSKEEEKEEAPAEENKEGEATAEENKEEEASGEEQEKEEDK